ncbi:Mps2p Ecym_2209 [Eremothecium cymbalariae DBVPG|uniref:Monopolar spindle protein 2 n=1 Tax=Eremothecium cymbalariae (strain CBS 270.75 / DBVPG 7215 / KCTC 17166 / NRRL Y-17582) TaxID=931890 RepID=G8JP53_ERECY|nr:Hypothetical protein Ecym_2209 [Eremothecium cymbalariae DBVPG\
MINECESILNAAWDIIDSKHQGFIYAKDIPELIRRLNTFVTHNLTTKANDEVISSFAKEQPFLKLSKDEFKAKFQSLVGTGIQTAVEMANMSDTKPRLFGSIRRSSIKGEETSKEEHMRKNLELEKLRGEIEDWKSKYQFLEREFLFYQTHHENLVDSTQHEFIISEMKRTIEEQTRVIDTLKCQMQGKDIVMVSKGNHRYREAFILHQTDLDISNQVA